jgi:hypothetical protein
MGSHPHGGRDEIRPSGIFNGQRSGNLAPGVLGGMRDGGCFDATRRGEEKSPPPPITAIDLTHHFPEAPSGSARTASSGDNVVQPSGAPPLDQIAALSSFGGFASAGRYSRNTFPGSGGAHHWGLPEIVTRASGRSVAQLSSHG